MDGLLVSCFYTYSDSHGVWIDYVYLVSILTAIVHWFVDRLRVSCFYTYSESHGVWIDYVYLVSILTAIVHWCVDGLLVSCFYTYRDSPLVCGLTTCILFLYLQR